MNNTDIITKLRIAMTDARQNESHFESWMILNEAICDAIDALAEQPAQQEPVAVPITSYEHRKFVLAGREWYERFAAFHDDCQIGEQLTWQEKTIRQQGYENGWNDAQRYLREPQASPPTQPQQEPVVIHQFRSPHCSDWYDGVPDHHDGYGPYEVRTLYTSPPTLSPAQRKPLTDEQIIKCWGQASGTRHGYVAFARAIEAAHGIKENT
jgi:hypothetical protein